MDIVAIVDSILACRPREVVASVSTSTLEVVVVADSRTVNSMPDVGIGKGATVDRARANSETGQRGRAAVDTPLPPLAGGMQAPQPRLASMSTLSSLPVMASVLARTHRQAFFSVIFF